MGQSSDGQPAPLNADKLAKKQLGFNRSAAAGNFALNNPNQTDQFGNQVTYSQTGKDKNGNPIYGVQQSLGETGQGFASGLEGLGKQYFQGAAGLLNSGGQNTSQGAFDQAYQYASANLEPRFQRQEDQARTRLANQGFDQSSEAYRNATNDLALQQNEARNNLVTNLQGQMFNQGMQNRQQQVGELQGLTAPGLQFGMGTTGVNTAGVNGVSMPTIDYAGLASQQYGQQMNAYQQEQNRKNAMMGGLASMGGTIAGAVLGGPIGASIGGRAAGSTAAMPSRIY